MKTTYRCHDILCGLRKPYNLLKYVYFPTPEDSPSMLLGRILTFCAGNKCYPMPTESPHFTIAENIAKRYASLISEDYSTLPAELSSEGTPLDLKQYDVTYQAKLIQIKDVIDGLEGEVIKYKIPSKDIALFLSSICGHDIGKGDLVKAITTCIEYMMEHERPIMVIPEPPEEVPEERKPAPPPPLRKTTTSAPQDFDWDTLFPK